MEQKGREALYAGTNNLKARPRRCALTTFVRTSNTDNCSRHGFFGDVRATCASLECSQGRSVRRKTCEVQDTPQGAYRVCSETVRCFRVCAGRCAVMPPWQGCLAWTELPLLRCGCGYLLPRGEAASPYPQFNRQKVHSNVAAHEMAHREQEVSTSVTETREPILPHSQPGGVSADDVGGMLSEFFAFAKEVQHDFISSAGSANAEGLTPPAHTQGLLGRWFNSKHAGSEHNPPGGPQQGSASEAGALPHLAQHLASSHCAYPAQDV
ncbi:hypothetical protein HaLaN_04466 [Haematococcus lacustris]|uniref:Uncharacterized protein n=1 Tax=Haematococcus lacustris TaxID=44745 RepID=A0A699YNJ0_HAELA|nr:hypothetical protein HaLaN_04466 [Haematococcus lacustris]